MAGLITENVKITQLLDPATVTTDQNSASIDLKDYGTGTIVVSVGESGDTLSGSVKIELELEESDDNSSFTDCADTVLSSYVAGTNDGCFAVIDAAAEDDAVYTVSYLGGSRYVRAVVNVTGTHTNGTPIAVIGLRGDPKTAPV